MTVGVPSSFSSCHRRLSPFVLIGCYLLVFVCWTISVPTVLAASNKDQHPKCQEWADAGECDANPNYMLINCPVSCSKLLAAQEALRAKLQTVPTFYDLQVPDITGNMLDFSTLRNKVVLIVNVASYCGFTDAHYAGLNRLYSTIQAQFPNQFEILAFPCNQFGQQEPEDAPTIQQFAYETKKVQFRVMSKVNVNGPNTDLAYLFLKDTSDFGIDNAIGWNFATYFVVSGNAKSIEAYSGVEPMELLGTIKRLIQEQQERGEEEEEEL